MSTKRGVMQDELEWSEAHHDRQEAKSFLNLAGLYAAHQDHPTYGLLCAARDRVREAMKTADQT